MNRVIALGITLGLVIGCAQSGSSQYSNVRVNGNSGNPTDTTGSGNPVAAPQGTTAVMDGEVRAVDAANSQVQITATGPSREACQQASRAKAAEEAIKAMVVPAAFQDAEWSAQVGACTSIERTGQKETAVAGGYRTQYIVRVNQQTLLQWAESRGHKKAAAAADVGLPKAEIMLVPEQVAGKWPKPDGLTEDYKVVESAVVNYLTSTGRDLELTDYETFFNAVQGEAARQVGGLQLDENYQIGGDMYMQFSIRNERPSGQTVKTFVRIKAAMTLTGQIAFNDERASQEVAVSQLSAAYKQAAQDAASAAFTKLFEAFQREYKNGIPYRVMITGVKDADESDIVTDAITPLVQPGQSFNADFRNGVYSGLIRANVKEYGSPMTFERALRKQLGDKGYTLRDPWRRSRFIAGELARK